MVEQVLSIKEVSAMCQISPRVIYAAFQSGDLAGRNLGGRKGWITTRTAVLDWVESGNMLDDEIVSEG